MQCVHSLVKTTIPNYLSGLPIPNSIGGWFKLGCKYCVFENFQIVNFEMFKNENIALNVELLSNSKCLKLFIFSKLIDPTTFN